MDQVSVIIEGHIAWVEINNPPVNATSQAVRAGLLQAVQTVSQSPVSVAILLCAGRTFVAGGDMTEFDAPPAEPHLPDVVSLIESSQVPWVAALHGTVLGGGLEIALGCAYRIALRGTRFGLPEVNVGLVPGAGGTQRLPRVVPARIACDMACWGRLVTADDLFEAQALDSVFDDDLRERARRFALALPPRPEKTSAKPANVFSDAEMAAERDALSAKFRGQASPLHNLDALALASLPFSQGAKRERTLHLSLRDSAESRTLRHAFFAERRVSKPAAIASGNVRDIQKIVIVGGGLMGTGIATAAVSAGFDVTLIEQNEEIAKSAQAKVRSSLQSALKRGKISADDLAQQTLRITTTTDFDQACGHDLAIEAVFEDVEIKKEVMRNLATVMDRDAILATNTSYLNPEQIFVDTPGPERCIGLHFFSPAHIMRLMEVVRLQVTSADTLATAFAVGKRLRKVSVLSGVCDGFIGNRMLAAYRREAEYLLADGAMPRDIDAAMRHFGYAMGPFEAQDMGGLQIAWAHRKSVAATRDPLQRYCAIADQLCEAGRTGQRVGKGWYDYAEGSRTPTVSAAVESKIMDYSAASRVTRRRFTEQDIIARLTAVLANEGARIVDEGIAENEEAVDMVQIHGYGFPRWRGGPMHYARLQGHDTVVRILGDVVAQSPGSWQIADRFADVGSG